MIFKVSSRILKIARMREKRTTTLQRRLISGLFVFSKIDPNDHDMKARLEEFCYDAADFSYDGMR
jgi:hypothetical protein